MLVFDLDHFKSINDRLGHLAGDEALRLVTTITREKLDRQDLLGRFGGDEFLVAVAGLDGAAAEALAETIRFDVVWRAPDQSPPIPDLSISVGIAIADPDRGYHAEALFRRADGALYRAKRAGRNRVVADDPAAAGTIVDERETRPWTAPLPD
jgi:diguanylate cyclase (GGDEF)-like protein